MADFQQRVEDRLLDMFGRTATNKQQIKEIATKAKKLRSALKHSGEYDLELTVELIADQLEPRSEGGPKWAWNNWIGTLVAFGGAPDGYKI